MAKREEVLVLDFGSQYSQLIARRIRELGVYCEIVRHDLSAEQIGQTAPMGLVLSGGPASVYAPNAPAMDGGILELGIPVLGICYGMQLISRLLGGTVERREGGEYGPAVLAVEDHDELFADLPATLDVWMSHGDRVVDLPGGFRYLAGTADCRAGAMGNTARKIFGVQFHPEVVHTPRGREVLSNFLFRICGCSGGWTMANFIAEATADIRRRVGDARVICGLSGGVDSSVVAALLTGAIGEKMTAVFVDNGLLRAGEAEEIRRFFGSDYPLNLKIVDAGEQFLGALEGVEDPERKRKIIGKTFIDVFEAEARRLGEFKFLAQGTLYPDVIESVSATGGPSATIKSHHNVGGLPEKLGFELIEPLRELFKDEVRRLGRELGLPERLVNRQPFPGPGLAVRIVGPVTAERVAVLQAADAIVREEMESWDGYDSVWQSFAVLLPVKSVGVMGDERTYDNAVAVRAVTSLDGMTADWVRLPYELMARLSARVINEVKGVNRVVYDISSKPPSTIEWE
ncbi:MAG TPA: glutamine-hydrolyzing GMP synthase [Phycisphaerae bacterium]|nr:glutamine-hydrolyzing GMP synthase [Phycisphaerae bacterium]HUU22381.1 glutamine-hydrolyzing GMP synthase [Phycisphaerae bacterium]